MKNSHPLARSAATALSFCLFGLLYLFFPRPPAQAAEESFLQIDWTGGASATTAVHPVNKTGWNKYSSKDANLDTATPGSVRMLADTFTLTDDTDADFGKGVRANVEVLGTGAGATMGISTNYQDPFCSALGQWTNMPFSPSMGAFSPLVRAGNYIYSLWNSGGYNQGFFRWSIADEKWEMMAAIPVPVGLGCALGYDGNDIIYALVGGNRKEFFAYQISTNTWFAKKDIPQTVGAGGSLVGVPTTGKVYAFCGNNQSVFYRYNPPTLITQAGSWSGVESAPFSIGVGASLVFPGAGDFLYASAGNGSSACAKFDMTASSNAWNSIANCPSGLGWYSNIVWPGTGDCLYAWRGDQRWFGIYHISSDTWESSSYPASPVKNVDIPALPFLINSFMYIYDAIGDGSEMRLLSNHSYSSTYRYYPARRKWREESIMRTGPTWGTDAIYVNTENAIYWSAGGGSKEFYKYYLDFYAAPSNSAVAYQWERLPDMSFAGNASGLERGGKFAYKDNDNFIYCLQGNNYASFSRFNLTSKNWEQLASLPQRAYYGATLVYAGNYLYATGGYNTDTGSYSAILYQYDPSNNTWTNVSTNNFGYFYAGACAVYPPGSDYIYYLRTNSRTEFMRYQISTQLWERRANLPDMIVGYHGKLVYSPNENCIYYMNGHDWSYYNGFAKYNITNNTWSVLPYPAFQYAYTALCASPTNMYYMGYSDTSGLQTYTFASGQWNNAWVSAPYTAGRYSYGSVVTKGDDVYFFLNNRTSYAWKYSISQQRWIDLIKLPFMTGGYGHRATYPGSGDYIYVSEGNMNKNFWRYNTVTGAWEQRTSCPYLFSYGARMVSDASGIYVCPGQYNNVNFLQFQDDDEGGSWITLNNMLDSIGNEGNGTCIISSGSNRGVYMLRQNGTVRFSKFDLSNQSWSYLADAPWAISDYCYLMYPGTGNFLYCLKGNGRDFAKYDLTQNTWTILTEASISVSGNAGGFYPGSGDVIYFYLGTGHSIGINVNRYSISENRWDEPIQAPANMSYGSCSCPMPSGEDIFFMQGGGSNAIYRYNINTSVWYSLNPSPNGLAWDAKCVYPGFGDYIYVSRGEGYFDVWRYSVSSDSWMNLAAPPYALSTGSAIVYHKDTSANRDYIYALRGGSTTVLMRYSIADNQWVERAPIPTSVSRGANIVNPGSGNYLYVTPGGGSTALWKYDTVANTWSTVSPLPMSNYGGIIFSPGFGDYLYFFVSYNFDVNYGSNYFYRYSMTNDTWEMLPMLPLALRGQASAMYPGVGDFIYLTSGYSTNMLMKYLLFSSGTYVSEVKEVGNDSGYGLVNWEDNGMGQIDLKVRTGRSPDLSDATSWSLANKVTKNSDLSQYASVKDKDEYMQYYLRFFCYDLTQRPQVDRVSIGYQKYPLTQEIISSPYNTGAPTNRLRNISWDSTLPAGTDVRFQMRTAPDASGVPGAWGPWLGPGGIQLIDYTFDTAAEYANTSEVVFSGGSAGLSKVLADYLYRQRIIVDNTTGAAGYTNCTIKVDISDANINFWAHVAADGSDIRFVDSDGKTPLGYRVLGFSRNKKTASAWVTVPSIPAASTKDIYLLYGKSTATSASDPTLAESLIGTDFYAFMYAFLDIVSTDAPNRVFIDKLDASGQVIASTYRDFTKVGQMIRYDDTDLTTYHVYSQKPITIFSSAVEPSSADDDDWYTVCGNDLWLWCPSNNYDGDVIITAYSDDTQVKITDLGVGDDSTTISLDKGNFWFAWNRVDGRGEVWHVESTKPVTVMAGLIAYNDGAEQIRSPDMKEYYFYAPNCYFTVMAYEDNTNIIIDNLDGTTGDYSGMLNKGKSYKHIPNPPTGTLTARWYVWADKPIFVTAEDLNGNEGSIYTSADTLISVGKEYYINSAQMRYLRLVSYEDGGNSISVDDDLGTPTVYQSLGQKGSSATIDSGPSLYRSLHIVGTKKFGIYGYGTGWGEAITPVFKPTDFNYRMPTNLVAEETPASSQNPQLAGWQYKETINVDNTANDVALTDFQVLVEVDSSHKDFWAHCRPDGADVRFLDNDDSTLLPYYTESFSLTEKRAAFWVKLPQLSNTEIKTMYMYYGKADAASLSDGNRVFEFFDDFDGGLSKWDAKYASLQTVSAILGMDSAVFNIPTGSNNIGTTMTIPTAVVSDRTYDWYWELYWSNGALVEAEQMAQPFALYNSLLSMTAGPFMAKNVPVASSVGLSSATWAANVATIRTSSPHGLIPDSPLASCSWSNNVATFTTTVANNVQAGKSVTVSGVTPGAYNGNYVVVSVVSPTEFTAALPLGAAPGNGTGGIVQRVGPQRVRISGANPVAYNGYFNVLAVIDATTFTISLAGPVAAAGSGTVEIGRVIEGIGGTFTNNEDYPYLGVRYRFTFTDVETGTSFGSIDSLPFDIPKNATTTITSVPLVMPVLTPGHLYYWSWSLLDDSYNTIFSSSSAPTPLFNIACGFQISSGPNLPAPPFTGGSSRPVDATFSNATAIALNNLFWRFTLVDTSQGGRQVAKVAHNGYLQATVNMSPNYNITTQVIWQTANKNGRHFIGISDPNARGATDLGNSSYLAGYDVLINSNGYYYDESGDGYTAWESIRTPYTATSWNSERITWSPNDPSHGKTGKVVYELASGDKLTYNAGFVAGPNLSIKPTIRSSTDAIYIDKVLIYKSANVTPYVGFVFHETPNPGGMDVYYTTNPVVQPVLGVFYDTNLTDFTDAITTPANTGVRYQISSDGYNWYWWDGAAWTKVTGGYSQTNAAAQIKDNLAAYVALFPRGEFWYRAFLHSEDGVSSPLLNNVTVTTTTTPTFYLTPAGNAINLLHKDTVNDQWFQYKAILSSVGKETPLLSAVTSRYITSYLHILSPNGGETVNVGQQVPITWESQAIDGATGKVKLEYSVDSGATWRPMASGLADTGSYTWTVPDDPSQGGLVRVTSEDFAGVWDVSDAPFRMLSLQVLTPDGGEIWEAGKTHQITWSTSGAVSNNLTIQYSLDNGATWVNASTQRPNTGYYNWVVPSSASDNVLIKIFDANKPAITDSSNAPFAIVPAPAFVITSPAGGEAWKYGLRKTISWKTNQSQFSPTVDIDYSRDSFVSDVQTVVHGVSTGIPAGPASPNADLFASYDWDIPDAVSEDVRVRVQEVSVPAGRDTATKVKLSSASFAIIEPTLSITSPVAGDVWIAGDTRRITWTSEGTISNDLRIEYSIDHGSTWSLIGDHQGNNGLFDWTIPVEAVSNTAEVRIADNTRPAVVCLTPEFRVLAYPTIEVVAPNGGEFAVMGESYEIRWNSWGSKLKEGGSDFLAISIYYSLDHGTTWQLESEQQMNDGTYTWDVPQIVGENNQCMVKVVDANDALIGDASDAPFTISNPSITISSPNGGEQMYATGNYTITWSGRGAISNQLKLEYSADAGASWNLIAQNEQNDGVYQWHAADVNSNQVLVRITDVTRPVVTDVSNAPFTIIPPTITLTAPNGGEEWTIGTDHDITWTSVGYDYGAIRDNLTLQYSINSGSTWTTFAVDEMNDGSFTWNVVDALSQSCRIRVFDATRPATQDSSDANFRIVLPYIQVLTPNGGENWPIGTTQVVSWKSVGAVSDNLEIRYSKDNFVTSTVIATDVARGLPNPDGTYTGSYTWGSVNDDYSTTAKVRITDLNRTQITDDSDNYFVIANPVLKVVRPNGGELFTVGDAEAIIWQNTGSVGNSLKIEYSKDNFVTVAGEIAAAVPNVAPYTFSWTVPNDLSADVRVRVTDNTRPIVWDKSDGPFTILPFPVITLIHPNGGEIWHVGADEAIIWSDNGGLISNNLILQYSADGGSTWKLIASGVANTGSYVWRVPDEVSNTAMVRVTDAARATTTDTSEAVFRIADPVITITSPNGGEVWAVGDRANVQWTTIGGVSDSLVLEFSPDGGSTYYFVATVANSGNYIWTLPDYVTSNAIFKIHDGMRPITVDVSDRSFVINPLPTLTITAPNGGEVLVLGDTFDVTWSWTGLSISDNLLLETSNDNFGQSRMVIASGVPNTGRYHWTIPLSSLTGNTLKMRITDGNRTVITDKSDGYFRIRGGFTITSPNGGEHWVSKSPQDVSWSTRGTISTVNLEYTTDDGATWETIASGVSNLGTYRWTLPNIRSSTCRVRVSDPNDNTVIDTSDAPFSMVYASVRFNVLDFDTLNHLTDFSVSEPNTGWQDSGVASPITRTELYPYGSYTTFFTKNGYIDNSATWSPPKSGTDVYVVTVNLENSASAQVTWDAILTYSYAPADDSLSCVGSLQRKGKLVGVREEERQRMGLATLTIYEADGTTVRQVLTAPSPNSSGMYNFLYPNTQFESGKVYAATLTIVYNDQAYTSSANIDVGAEKLQYEFFTQTAAQLTDSVASIKNTVETSARETSQVVRAVQDQVITTLNAVEQNVTQNVNSSLSQVESNVTRKVEDARQLTDSGFRSAILNTESTIKRGDTLVLRYRTYSGLQPVVDVYSPNNVQRVSKAVMKENGTTGVYEYAVKFSTGWGKGEFTIICSEPTKGTIDALAIEVVESDIDSVASQVSAILGSTTGLSEIKDAAGGMSNMFAMIESALSKIGKDVVKEVKGDVVSTPLNAVYDQLTMVSKQLKQMTSGTTGVTLEKLYQVSEDKRNDLGYLKNKTQELKAVMELNQKMVENLANKPVTQTWFEYK